MNIRVLAFIGFFSAAAVAEGGDLPSTYPKTLDDAIEAVKLMKQDGRSRQEIASWLATTMDNRVVNINSMERMTLLENWIPRISSTSSSDAAFGAWRNQANFDYESTAEWTWENRVGQCSEHAGTAYYILKRAGIEGNLRIFTAPGHEVAVWGIDSGADPNDPSTWGNEAWVVDGWLGKALNPGEVQENSYFKAGGSVDERPIVESTTSFDNKATAWTVAGKSQSQSAEEVDCFVATVVYGTPLADEIRILRKFRDQVLRQSEFGRTLVNWYEIAGPDLARVARNEPAKALVRIILLEPVVLIVQSTEIFWQTPESVVELERQTSMEVEERL